jgi:ankyrin repeat protein
MEASRTGNSKAVQVLLDHGAQVNAKETLRGTTAIMWAAEQNHADVIRLLVARGADPSVQSVISEPKKRYGVNYKGTEFKSGGLTALILAAREGALDSVAALAAASADLNQASGDGSTAMLVAIQNGHYDVARYLLEHGADPNLSNEKGWNPLYLAVKHRNIETGTIPVPNAEQALDFIKMLLDKGANPNLRLKANTEIRNGQRATWLNEAGATPFLRAGLCGDIEVMRLLLKYNADPKTTTDDHTTPLMAAAGVGYTDGFIHDRSEEETIEAMKLILESGANVNDANDAGLTALHGAAHKASLAEINFLVARGADLAAKDKGGSESSKRFGQKTEGLLPLDWAEGVTIGVQSAIYHAEAVDLITRLMKEKGIPIPARTRTIGGNAVAKK